MRIKLGEKAKAVKAPFLGVWTLNEGNKVSKKKNSDLREILEYIKNRRSWGKSTGSVQISNILQWCRGKLN